MAPRGGRRMRRNCLRERRARCRTAAGRPGGRAPGRRPARGEMGPARARERLFPTAFVLAANKKQASAPRTSCAIHEHGRDRVLPLPRGGLGARGAGGVPLGAVGPELGGLRGGRAGGRRAALPAPGVGGRRGGVLPAVHDGDAARRGRRPAAAGAHAVGAVELRPRAAAARALRPPQLAPAAADDGAARRRGAGGRRAERGGGARLARARAPPRVGDHGARGERVRRVRRRRLPRRHGRALAAPPLALALGRRGDARHRRAAGAPRPRHRAHAPQRPRPGARPPIHPRRFRRRRPAVVRLGRCRAAAARRRRRAGAAPPAALRQPRRRLVRHARAPPAAALRLARS